MGQGGIDGGFGFDVAPWRTEELGYVSTAGLA